MTTQLPLRTGRAVAAVALSALTVLSLAACAETPGEADTLAPQASGIE